MLKNIVLFILLGIIYSCVDKTENQTAKFSTDSRTKENFKTLQLEFPDTVLSKENIQGKIRYGLELDSLKPSDISSRYIFFHITTSNVRKGLSLEEIKMDENRTIYEDTIGNGIFNFEVYFGLAGKHVLNGVIEDIRILNEELGDKDKVRIVTKETSISKNIYVKDSI